MNGIKIGKVLAESFGKHRPFTLNSIEHGKRWYLNLEPDAKSVNDWVYELASQLWVCAKPLPDGANNEFILIYDPYQ